MKKSHALTLIVLIGLIASLSGLYGLEFIRINSRFALFVAEMEQYGVGLFPTIYGKPYTDYPSTMMIMMYITSLGGAYINMFTATLPTAIATVLMLVFTYLLGERFRKDLGFYGVVMCFLSFQYLEIIRAPGLDVFVAAAAVMSVYVAYTAAEGDGRKRLLWIPLLLIGSYSIRGPLGIAIPAAAVIAIHLARLDWKRILLWGAICGLTGFICVVVSIWLCLEAGGKELVELFLFNQVIGRMGKAHPIWYYFTNAVGSYSVTYPLAIAVGVFYGNRIFARPQKTDSGELVFMRMLCCWALLILLGMSIPGSKHLRYVIASVPPMALLCGWIFFNPDRFKFFTILQKIFFIVSRIMPFLGLATLLIAALVLRLLNIDSGLPVLFPALVFVALCVVVIYVHKNMNGEWQRKILLAVCAGCMITVRITLDPVENHRENARDFSLKLDTLRGNDQLYFYRLGPDGDELKYLVNIPPERRFTGKYFSATEARVPTQAQQEQTITKPEEKDSGRKRLVDRILALLPERHADAPLHPIFVFHGGFHEMLEAPAGTIFLAREKHFRTMPEKYREQFEELMTGSLGRRECVAFRRKTTVGL
ncbi:MAG: hypothetical protein JXR78_16095 [Victivallales bacterium]|nr:hypothetical protein [Victivallales bacterium]